MSPNTDTYTADVRQRLPCFGDPKAAFQARTCRPPQMQFVIANQRLVKILTLLLLSKDGLLQARATTQSLLERWDGSKCCPSRSDRIKFV